MNDLKLLPAGAFVVNVKRNNEKVSIAGRYSMFVWDAFLTSKGIESYLDITELVSRGLTIKECVALLALALNDYDRTNPRFDNISVMDLIDEAFEKGINDDLFINLMHHGIGRIAVMEEVPKTDEANEPEDEEKKSE